MNVINNTLNGICRKYCSGIEFCPSDGYCEYAKEIRKNIVEIITHTNDETD